MTFETDEHSASSSRPIDLYQIVTPSGTSYLTSYQTDVSYGGVTYTATGVNRSTIQLGQELTAREFIVYLPITHALVQRYTATGIPEDEVRVTMRRLQAVSAIAFQEWTGLAGGISIDGHTALLRVPSLTDDAMKLRLPTIAIQRLCNHVLYDTRCTVNRVFASGLHQITAISGNTVTTDSTASGSHYTFGDIIHAATGQRRMVLEQSGNVLTLAYPLVGAAVLDYVTIAAGCDHTVTTCRDKFNNVVNFGGHPQMNAAFNPWLPHGLGQSQQA